jgi:hypothetical protein
VGAFVHFILSNVSRAGSTVHHEMLLAHACHLLSEGIIVQLFYSRPANFFLYDFEGRDIPSVVLHFYTCKSSTFPVLNHFIVLLRPE